MLNKYFFSFKLCLATLDLFHGKGLSKESNSDAQSRVYLHWVSLRNAMQRILFLLSQQSTSQNER